MTPTVPRRRRTVLFTPGTHPERIAKALSGPAADVVVADLEDGVAPEDKPDARKAVARVLSEMTEAPAERAVRINAWPGELAEADLAAVMQARPDLLVVPKVHDIDALRSLDARLMDAEKAAGAEAGSTRLLLILETAAGVLGARSLARASPRVAAIALGAEDLAADVGMRRTSANTEVATARGLVALSAAAAGVQAVDMITADYQDTDRCGREAAEARGLGYSGKMVVHPGQVAVVHAAFAPTAEETAWARKVVAAVAEEGIGDGGVIVVDGKMIDRPLVEQAKRILRDAEG